MKWLFLILGYFLKSLSRMTHGKAEASIDIKQLVVENAKKALFALLFTSILSSMFVGGAIITVITLAAQFDQSGTFGLSAMLIGGMALMITSLVLGWISFSPSRESKLHETQRVEKEISQNTISNQSGLSEALVMLVHDFIKEREFKRAKEVQTMQETVSSARFSDDSLLKTHQTHYRSQRDSEGELRH